MSLHLKGTSLLESGSTVPGCHLTDEEKKLFLQVLDACSKYGLDYYPTYIQKLRHDEMSEIAAYGGFPVRYPHWSFGMEYESLRRGYYHGNHRIYELVINTNPCVIYLMNSNSLVDNVTVVAHATGHNDFFKNNIFFEPTNVSMMDKFANHGTRMRKYMTRWGRERVTEFIDHVLRIQTLIDPVNAWEQRVIKEPIILDSREYEHPRRLKVDKDRMHMEPWINSSEFKESENERIRNNDAARELDIFKSPDKNIFKYVKDNAALKPWQADIMSMLYEEAMYFAPQRQTKTLNEGWASFIDYEIMSRQGYVSHGQKQFGDGIIEYATHKMAVLGGKYSVNPYKLGFYLLLDIEDRWNKGKFGQEWENCRGMREREEWDKELGLGKQKLFEVRKICNDFTFISEYFTQEFCQEYEFFEWKKYPNGEYKIENKGDTPEGFKRIKKKMLTSKINGGLPDIRLCDPNHQGKGLLFLQHFYNSDGRQLHDSYTRDVICSLYYLWQKQVVLATCDKDGGEKVYICVGTDANKDVAVVSRKEYEEKW